MEVEEEGVLCRPTITRDSFHRHQRKAENREGFQPFCVVEKVAMEKIISGLIVSLVILPLTFSAEAGGSSPETDKILNAAESAPRPWKEKAIFRSGTVS